ncbi:hypothetical protein CB0940_11227 [Cercospora beticola]|uniref:PA14 domain-containing protein n=1 Tax=Cercospora beticola TaxID=122368 RepID=A0A2G5HE42_CERBT|nr:hypothetical protein CB0940_11227 [Cercospora beticola]PIA90807.1 hypothetical protein CB0940_11227 [Cercospora beticola]WPB08059.1 hypothetical protein RHO25_012723 [Cercospora beticola]
MKFTGAFTLVAQLALVSATPLIPLPTCLLINPLLRVLRQDASATPFCSSYLSIATVTSTATATATPASITASASTTTTLPVATIVSLTTTSTTTTLPTVTSVVPETTFTTTTLDQATFVVPETTSTTTTLDVATVTSTASETTTTVLSFTTNSRSTAVTTVTSTSLSATDFTCATGAGQLAAFTPGAQAVAARAIGISVAIVPTPTALRGLLAPAISNACSCLQIPTPSTTVTTTRTLAPGTVTTTNTITESPSTTVTSTQTNTITESPTTIITSTQIIVVTESPTTTVTSTQTNIITESLSTTITTTTTSIVSESSTFTQTLPPITSTRVIIVIQPTPSTYPGLRTYEYRNNLNFNNPNPGEDVTAYNNRNFLSTGLTPDINGISSRGGTNCNVPGAGFKDCTQLSLVYQGFLYAPITGTYTLSVPEGGVAVDNYFGVWSGPTAYASYNNGNADFIARREGDGRGGVNQNGGSSQLRLIAGQYFPVTFIFINGGGPGSVEFRVTTPGQPTTASTAGLFIPACIGSNPFSNRP